MSSEGHLDLFKSAANEWLCDPYSVEIRYLAIREDDANVLLSCSINFWPIKFATQKSLAVVANNLIAGQEQLNDMSLNKIKLFINNLEEGKLVLNDMTLSLIANHSLSFYTEMISNDRWYCDAHLLVLGEHKNPISNIEITKINSALRQGKLPFDGLNDLVTYLNLPDPFSGQRQPQIEIRISPPTDIRIEESSLSKGKFNLILHAHPKLNTKNISLAFRTFPETLTSRKQVSSQIKWKSKKDGIQVGKLVIGAAKAFAVQAILMVGSNTVRRQFFDDILKVPNRRLFAISAFDKDLKMLKQALSDTHSSNFEKAVNSLAYILGFSGGVINETNAPDIILSTPNESLVVIECTTRMADFATKLGKLVDRKNALITLLESSGDSRKVYSYLVCGLPKNQIAHDENYFARHKVTLLTRESLDEILNQLKYPQDLEKLLSADEKNLENLLLQNNNPQVPLL
jgi:hypothetical protein